MRAYVDLVEQGGVMLPRLCVIGEYHELTHAMKSVKDALERVGVIIETMPVLPTDVQTAIDALAYLKGRFAGFNPTGPTTPLEWSKMEAP